MSCGNMQSFNVTLHQVEASLVHHNHRRWEWSNNGDIVLTIANISYCDPSVNISIQRQKTVAMEYRKLLNNAVHNYTLLQRKLHE